MSFVLDDQEPIDAWSAQRLAIEANMDNPEFTAALEKIEKAAREGRFWTTLYHTKHCVTAEQANAITALRQLHFRVKESNPGPTRTYWVAYWD